MKKRFTSVDYICYNGIVRLEAGVRDTEVRDTDVKNYTISYDPLWKKLIDFKMSKTELGERTGLSKTTIAKMGKGESVTLEVIGRICVALKAPISDVVEITVHENDDPAGD